MPTAAADILSLDTCIDIDIAKSIEKNRKKKRTAAEAASTWRRGTRRARALSAKMSRRILHTMLRVGNVERSLNFYCGVLGMKGARAVSRRVRSGHLRADTLLLGHLRADTRRPSLLLFLLLLPAAKFCARPTDLIKSIH